MSQKTEQNNKEKSRFSEITKIIRSHDIVRGITPVKLREIFEELGPTYIKLGQILSTRSDILSKAYCDELSKLRSDVDPMSFEEVLSVIEDSYKTNWQDIFASIEEKPLGSASIAQVHRARLLSGEAVVIKVQRPGIYDTMKRDINMMHRAVSLIPLERIKQTLNLDMVLDELWVVAQEEMNFLEEAANMEEFSDLNREVRYFKVPKLYRPLTTGRVLVMEYIDGISLLDKEELLECGYDLAEIGTKLVDNYMKQVMEDGFFHADPHPGNLCVQEGKIVWMDMGMMGRLSERDRSLITDIVEAIAVGDTGRVQDAVMVLGEFRAEPDKKRLYHDLDNLMAEYFSASLGDIDVTKVMQSLMEIMKQNNMTLPHGLTMLARGLAQLEGILIDISPEISITQIAANRLKQQYFDPKYWKERMKSEGKELYLSAHDLIEIPTLASKILREYEKGQTHINLDIHSAEDLTQLLHHLVRNLVIGLCIMALLISSAIVCTTDMWPKIFGIPALGALGYFIAVVTASYVLVRYLWRKRGKKK